MEKKKPHYKPFDKKFVVFKKDDDGCCEIAFFTVDRRNNRIPIFYDTAADAVIAIGEHYISCGEAVKRGDMDADNLNEPFSHYVATASLNKEGHLYVATLADTGNPYEPYEDEVIYNDHIIHLM